jgi:hypothetical protein
MAPRRRKCATRSTSRRYVAIVPELFVQPGSFDPATTNALAPSLDAEDV